MFPLKLWRVFLSPSTFARFVQCRRVTWSHDCNNSQWAFLFTRLPSQRCGQNKFRRPIQYLYVLGLSILCEEGFYKLYMTPGLYNIWGPSRKTPSGDDTFLTKLSFIIMLAETIQNTYSWGRYIYIYILRLN